MIIIKPSVSLISDPNPYKTIELIGRMCYKSEDKITDDSCYKFVDNLVARQHFAMLEHARFAFIVKCVGYPVELSNIPAIRIDCLGKTWLVGCSMSHLYNTKYMDNPFFRMFQKIVYSMYGPKSAEPRILSLCVEDGDIGHIEVTLVEDLGVCNLGKDIDNYVYPTFKFICDRGVSHELVRHRCSVAQESTRYCNYAKEKFGSQITFIEPADFDNTSDDAKAVMLQSFDDAESAYLELINEHGWTPQQARAVLPNALKTEVILTMSNEQWEHFFNLRSKGTTGAPHPDMKVVADMAYELFTSGQEKFQYSTEEGKL